MRKRSKKRIPQDEKPWSRIIARDDANINIFNKAVSHWHSGNHRYSQKLALSNQQLKQFASINSIAIMQDSSLNSSIRSIGATLHQQLFHKYYFSKFKNLNSVKNFCLFLGKSSTYNRKLFASRQTVRKLMRTGLITGMQKK